MHILRVEILSVYFIYFTLLFTAYTDEIFLKEDKSIKSKILAISKNEIIIENTKIQIPAVKRCVFDAFKVASKDTGLILDDGTILSGIVLKRENKEVYLRSTSFGLLKINEEKVAAEYFNGYKDLPALKDFPCTIDKGNNKFVGKILWTDSNTTGVMTESGLKKIPTPELLYIARQNFKREKKIILRNGDIINFPVEFTGGKVKFNFANGLELQLSAISEINFEK
ncbi:MAG TPA: hypothetical protein P5270_01275 [Victivallales bacterium]|nr:hypothetical protein [Victivallales bacterium]HPO89794.1 hypothetical protein [Victivallales bacterium]HRR27971.1 hypothetical protein [Victivallales bacterium]HRU01099.1 hypothetical protein [Victivallales bacterium]